jgi:hypothetical protein
MPACDGSRRKAADWPPETMLRVFTGRFGGIFLTLKHYKMKSLCADAEALFIRPGEDPIMVAQPL